MKLINLFDKYFLALIMVQGLIVFFHDHKNFKTRNDVKTAVKARVVAIVIMATAITLFIVRELT